MNQISNKPIIFNAHYNDKAAQSHTAVVEDHKDENLKHFLILCWSTNCFIDWRPDPNKDLATPKQSLFNIKAYTIIKVNNNIILKKVWEN